MARVTKREAALARTEGLIGSHSLLHEVVRRDARTTLMVLKTACTTCLVTVEMTLWEEDYGTPEAAMRISVKRSRRNFEFDCARELANSVLGT